MIERLRGRIIAINDTSFILDVGGVGFKLISPTSTLSQISGADEVSVHTRLVVREDSLTLYGFYSRAEADLFSRLVDVSGVGPRIAVAVLSVMTPAEFERAIAFEDADFLTSVPGVGRKLADRLVVELKDRMKQKKAVTERRQSAGSASVPTAEAVDALVSLGYTRTEAGVAVQKVCNNIDGQPTTEQLVHGSLQVLGRRD